jgi:thiosulfate reductase/polysulfide reductase chain A
VGYLQDARGRAPGTMPAYWADGDQPAGGYTPAWAAGISGVAAADIIAIAEDYANNSPGSVIMTYRGAVMHFNGTNTERVAQMLEGMCGNIDTQGGRVHGVGAGWDYHDTYPTPSAPADEGKLSLENKSAYVAASHGANHQTLETIKAETDANGNVSPIACYMVYCYTPAYANGNMQESINILKSKTYIPYLVVSDVAYSEAGMYADLLLPDTNYLERWDYEDMVSQHHIPEWYIRQPAVAPLGEVEDFKNTCINLAALLVNDRPEMAEVAAIGSAENFVEAACNDTPEVNDAGVAAGFANGFEFMKSEGAYYDPNATPAYLGYMSTVTITDPIYDAGTPPPDDLADYHCKDLDGTIYTATLTEFTAGYRATGYKHYVAQELASNPGTYYKGFKPDKVNKSGLFELESVIIGAKDYPPMPLWMPIPEHQSLASDELILTTFKSTTQTHSRTQNCKYNTEIDHHNPAWINTATAAALGIADGDTVTLTRTVELINDMAVNTANAKGTTTSTMDVEVKVTQAVHPKVIAISHSLGHWAYGRYASGNSHPMATDTDQAAQAAADPDADLIWWTEFGFRHNWIQPNAGDPIGGGLRFFDTVVTIS